MVYARITEQPYKTPFYVALLRLLHDRKGEEDSEEKAPLGRQILEDFWKGFQAYMDKLAWRDIKHSVRTIYILLIQTFLTF